MECDPINTKDIKQILIASNNETKKINYKKEKKPRVETLTWDLMDEEMESTFQYNILKTLLEKDKLTNMTKITKLIREHIKIKRTSYKQQDINKKRFNNVEFIEYGDIIELLIDCELKCHYCACEIFLLYTFVRETKQWTLDRINNDIGHNKANLVVACLECNLKRRRTNKDAFMFTKNLKIIREGI
jgi:hypothetical protein